MQIDGKFSTPRKAHDSLGTTRNVNRVRILIRVTARSLPDGRQSGSYPETDFAEMTALRNLTAPHFPEADFWPAGHSFRVARHPEEEPVPLLRSPRQHSWPWHLLLQPRREVRNHGDRLADLLRNPVEKKFLAIGRDVVEDLRRGPIGDQLLSHTELQCAARIR
jgi:hypothetical protein